mmetsp:Transcript_60729/g.160883  ORF Transcript_60729/g.160883 Transcript_60729/m.160883 type:complete len:244 (-) Transcript_60729:69-800(-)
MHPPPTRASPSARAQAEGALRDRVDVIVLEESDRDKQEGHGGIAHGVNGEVEARRPEEEEEDGARDVLGAEGRAGRGELVGLGIPVNFDRRGRGREARVELAHEDLSAVLLCEHRRLHGRARLLDGGLLEARHEAREGLRGHRTRRHVRAHVEVLQPVAPERVVTHERDDAVGDAGPQRGGERARPAVVHRDRAELKQRRVRHRPVEKERRLGHARDAVPEVGRDVQDRAALEVLDAADRRLP